jgi:molecular chaperone HtpG
MSFVRVDSDHIDNLIKKDETKISKLSDEEKKNLEEVQNVKVNTSIIQVECRVVGFK